MIPVSRPTLEGNEKKYLLECIETGWISSEGPFIRRFETGIAAICGRKHGIAVSNGSVALEVALAALGIGPGDEVILPAFTIISCAAAVVRCGATPVLIDADPLTWNMNPRLIEGKITPRTKAIMVVHIYGLPADLDPILALAKSRNLFIIEDAAEQQGQTYKGRAIGSFGDISTLSFYPNKHITTGEGGMLLVDNEDLECRCRALRNLCFDTERRFIHEELGWNFRMSNLQAAVGVAQMERLDETIEKKRTIGRWYNSQLSGNASLQLPVDRTPYAENIYWVYGVVLDDRVPFDAREAIARLREKGIGARHFFWPMNHQPALKKMGLFANESYPQAERLANRGFYLPSGPGLDRNEACTVVESLNEILK